MYETYSEEKEEEGVRSVIFAVDLMNFKLLNDQHGHRMGDRALRRYAHALKKIANEAVRLTGYVWNVYRVGGDEFVVFGRTKSREVFQKVAQMCAAIKLPWARLVPQCSSEASSFGRVGGVFGKNVRYVDADMLERYLKGTNTASRNTIVDSEKIETLILYYLDKNDRDEVINEQESAILEAMKKREFRLCAKIQRYIDFLREGFSKLKDEKCSIIDTKEVEYDRSLTKVETLIYYPDPVERLSKRPSVTELFPKPSVSDVKPDSANEGDTRKVNPSSSNVKTSAASLEDNVICDDKESIVQPVPRSFSVNLSEKMNK